MHCSASWMGLVGVVIHEVDEAVFSVHAPKVGV